MLLDNHAHAKPEGKLMVIHVIDDDEPLGRTVARAVSRAGWESAVYRSADEFLARIDDLPLGCVIADINMPGMNGLKLIEILHANYRAWPVIIMTGQGNVAAAVQSFRNGAVHFLEKPFKRLALLEALDEAVLIGQHRKIVTVRQQGTVKLDRLTKRELEVLEALADGSASKSVAWMFGISIRTVEMHRSNILSKLGVRNTAQAVAMFQASACLVIPPVPPSRSVPAE